MNLKETSRRSTFLVELKSGSKDVDMRGAAFA